MPGCGKSTFGRKAAAGLGMEFIDLDAEIVNRAGKSINLIFEEDGEDYFRELESELLKKISEKHESFIMATGGGAPCFFDNMEYMNSRGRTFYIDTSIEFLMERLSQKGIDKRPLLKKIGRDNLEEGLRDKLKNRLPYYSRAEVILPFEQDLEKRIMEILQD